MGWVPTGGRVHLRTARGEEQSLYIDWSDSFRHNICRGGRICNSPPQEEQNWRQPSRGGDHARRSRQFIMSGQSPLQAIHRRPTAIPCTAIQHQRGFLHQEVRHRQITLPTRGLWHFFLWILRTQLPQRHCTRRLWQRHVRRANQNAWLLVIKRISSILWILHHYTLHTEQTLSNRSAT